MGNTRDPAAARAASRPTSPVTPVQSSTYRCPSASPDKKKPAWVVADWKHRVSDPGLVGRVSTAGSLHTKARAQLVKERKQQLTHDYASLHDTINKILARCSHVQQRLGTSTALSLNDSKSQSPTYISTRSTLLFELPSGAEAAATYKTASTHMTPNSKQDVSTLCVTKDSGSLAAAQQEHKTQVQQCARSWGGAVDLNPGFSFRPGTPQRLKATCSDASHLPLSPLLHDKGDRQHSQSMPGSTCKISSSSNTVRQGSSCYGISSLTHREQLQAGIQQLNGEFYRRLHTLRQAAEHHAAA